MTIETRPNNPGTALVVGALNDQSALLREIRNALVRRESPAPSTFPFWPGGLRVQPQVRITQFVVCPIALTTFGIRIGSNVRYRFRASAGVIVVPAEIVLNMGETITLVDMATGLEATDVQVIDAFINAYIDVPSRPDE